MKISKTDFFYHLYFSNYDIVWETLTYQNCSQVEVTDDDGTVTTKEE